MSWYAKKKEGNIETAEEEDSSIPGSYVRVKLFLFSADIVN